MEFTAWLKKCFHVPGQGHKGDGSPWKLHSYTAKFQAPPKSYQALKAPKSEDDFLSFLGAW